MNKLLPKFNNYHMIDCIRICCCCSEIETRSMSWYAETSKTLFTFFDHYYFQVESWMWSYIFLLLHSPLYIHSKEVQSTLRVILFWDFVRRDWAAFPSVWHLAILVEAVRVCFFAIKQQHCSHRLLQLKQIKTISLDCSPTTVRFHFHFPNCNTKL